MKQTHNIAPGNTEKTTNNDKFDTDVLIIGYGPTGLAASLALGSRGVKHMVIERHEDIYPRARAVTVGDWTMRLFQSVGMDQILAKDMDKTDTLRWVDYDGRQLMRMDFPPSILGSHPRANAIYQPTMEATLRQGAHLYSRHSQVLFGEEATAVQQDDDSVTVTIQNRDTNNTRQLRARYVLACDGGSSHTRNQLGITLVGESEETRWVVIDAKVKRWWPERHILTFWSDQQRPVVDIALAQGNHRWEFPLRAEESDKDYQTHDQLWTLLTELGVSRDDVDIHQHAFYTHHSRQAESWREGRVFLLGDAAHLMPPWAGAGMQCGIQDAFNLGWKLSEVLKERLPPSLLDSYEPERRPHVEMMTGISNELGRVIKREISDEELAAMAPAPGEPAPEPPMLMPPVLATGWLNGDSSEGSIIGKMIPQPQVANAKGKRAQLDDILGNGFVLIGDGIDPVSQLSDQEKAQWDRLGARYFTLLSPEQHGKGIDDIVDLEGTLLTWLRNYGSRAIALRPDRFVVAAAESGLSLPIAGHS